MRFRILLLVTVGLLAPLALQAQRNQQRFFLLANRVSNKPGGGDFEKTESRPELPNKTDLPLGPGKPRSIEENP